MPEDLSPNQPPVRVLVCTTCRSASAPPLGEVRAGAMLLERLAGSLPEGVEAVPVECLSNCTRGCTIALRGPGRWTYVYGNIDPETHLEAVLEGAARYRAAGDGLVPWRERPEHFRKNCIARIPPLED